MSSSECSRRRACKVAVAAICSANGFGSAQDAVLETLTEMLQSCMCNDDIFSLFDGLNGMNLLHGVHGQT